MHQAGTVQGEQQVTEPRGVRNKNATNIEYHANTPWKGLDEPPSDGRFCRFVAPEWGLRATLMILSNYQKRGLVTLLQMVTTWAPPHENNPDSYAGSVARAMGINPHAAVDLHDKERVIAMLKGMVAVECGPAPAGTANGGWLDDAVYEAAWRLWKPPTQSRTVRGSVAAGGAAVAGAVIEAAQTYLPQAADAATLVTPIWPEVARWVLLGIALAGAVIAYRARTEAQREPGQ